jgi:hypothetical protein
MTLDDLTQLALTHWPHAALFVAGLVTKPAWRKLHDVVVLLARAIVAHEDGDDKTAIADFKNAAGDLLELVHKETALPEAVHTEEHGIQSLASTRIAPPGTVPEWPKR